MAEKGLDGPLFYHTPPRARNRALVRRARLRFRPRGAPCGVGSREAVPESGVARARRVRAVSRASSASRADPRVGLVVIAIPSRTRRALAFPPYSGTVSPLAIPLRGLARLGFAPLRDRSRAVGRHRSGPRGITACARGRGFRCGRGRGAMRAVRRLVCSPPLPGPPRARAASRLASPGRRSAARPRASPPLPSVPSGRSCRCSTPSMRDADRWLRRSGNA